MEGDNEDLEYEEWLAEIKRTILAHPPRCLNDVRGTPREASTGRDFAFEMEWPITCTCGNTRGRISGYPLHDLLENYRGAELMASPFSFDCSACGRTAVFFDTDVHGYHAEVGLREGGVGSVKVRGDGQPKAFPCPSCDQRHFEVTCRFVWIDFEIADEEPDWPLQDFFNGFELFAKCSSCGVISLVAGMDL